MVTPSLLGTDLTINVNTAANQVNAHVLPTSNGGAFIYWTVPGAAAPVQARVITPSGGVIGNPFNPSLDLAYNIPGENLTAAELANGEVLLVSRTGNDVFYAKVSSTGQEGVRGNLSFSEITLTGRPVVETTSDGQVAYFLKTSAESLASFSALGSENFDDLELNNGAAVSTRDQSGQYWNVLDSAGIGTTALAIATARTTSSGELIDLHVVSTATLIDSGPIPVPLGANYNLGSFELTEIGTGGFLASWRDGTTLKAQRYDASGQTTGQLMQINAIAPENVSVTALADGRVLMVWDDNISESHEILGRMFTASGDAESNVFLINRRVAGEQTDPSAAVLANGDILVIWNTSTSTGQDTNGRLLSVTRPDAENDTIIADGGAPMVVDVLANDTDPNGDTIAVATVGSARNGTVTSEDGVVQYVANAGYTGPDSFTYGIADANGLTDTATVFVTVVPPEQSPPRFEDPSIDLAAIEDATQQLTVAAVDDDGDSLTYWASAAAHGAVTGGAGGIFIYKPIANFHGADSFIVTAEDGRGGTATLTVDVTVAPVNDAPAFSSGTRSLSVSVGFPALLTAQAIDPEGDAVSYSAASPAHGTITGGVGGRFTYTPSTGFIGSDSFTVTASDSGGGSSVQTVLVSVMPPAGNQWRLFAQQSFEGSVGGAGGVFGTSASEDISILDLPCAVTFDPSFNRGGDIIRLPGDASNWSVAQTGSSAVFSDGNTFATVPIGPAGLAIVFDDGARSLRFDAEAQKVFIGEQSIEANAAAVAAAPDEAPLPAGSDPAATARLFLSQGGAATLDGAFGVFGTSSPETVTVLGGTIQLDPSFNRGGDTLLLDQSANSFVASIAGSSVLLDSDDLDMTIPIGPAGLMISFEGDEHLLRFDGATGSVFIGEQIIGSDAAPLAFA